MSIYTDSLEAFRERFADVLTDPNEDDVLKDGAEVPDDWQDTISEIADSLVPVYTLDIVQEWLDDGCPDIDDPGLIEGVTDVARIIAAVLYERYSQELYELAEEAGFND